MPGPLPPAERPLRPGRRVKTALSVPGTAPIRAPHHEPRFGVVPGTLPTLLRVMAQATTSAREMRARLAAHPRRRWYALVVVASGMWLSVMNISIVNIAMPTMAKDLGVDLAGIGMGRHRLLRHPGDPAAHRRSGRRPLRPSTGLRRPASIVLIVWPRCSAPSRGAPPRSSPSAIVQAVGACGDGADRRELRRRAVRTARNAARRSESSPPSSGIAPIFALNTGRCARSPVFGWRSDLPGSHRSSGPSSSPGRSSILAESCARRPRPSLVRPARGRPWAASASSACSSALSRGESLGLRPRPAAIGMPASIGAIGIVAVRPVRERRGRGTRCSTSPLLRAAIGAGRPTSPPAASVGRPLRRPDPPALLSCTAMLRVTARLPSALRDLADRRCRSCWSSPASAAPGLRAERSARAGWPPPAYVISAHRCAGRRRSRRNRQSYAAIALPGIVLFGVGLADGLLTGDAHGAISEVPKDQPRRGLVAAEHLPLHRRAPSGPPSMGADRCYAAIPPGVERGTERAIVGPSARIAGDEWASGTPAARGVGFLARRGALRRREAAALDRRSRAPEGADLMWILRSCCSSGWWCSRWERASSRRCPRSLPSNPTSPPETITLLFATVHRHRRRRRRSVRRGTSATGSDVNGSSSPRWRRSPPHRCSSHSPPPCRCCSPDASSRRSPSACSLGVGAAFVVDGARPETSVRPRRSPRGPSGSGFGLGPGFAGPARRSTVDPDPPALPAARRRALMVVGIVAIVRPLPRRSASQRRGASRARSVFPPGQSPGLCSPFIAPAGSPMKLPRRDAAVARPCSTWSTPRGGEPCGRRARRPAS